MAPAGGSEGANGLLVIGLLGEPFEDQIWIWDLLQRVRPQFDELAASTTDPMPAPIFRKAMLRRFRLADVLGGHRRVALVATAAPGRRLSQLTHWHIAPGARLSAGPPGGLAASWPLPGLAPIHQAAPASETQTLPIWPYWLDTLPPEGLDFLALPRLRTAAALATGPHLTLASALLGLLWDIARGGATARRDRRAA